MVRNKQGEEKSSIRLPESEMKVMEYLWERGAGSAKETAEHMQSVYGWKKNTTYTVLGKLVAKGVLQRSEPGFLCKPLLERQAVSAVETEGLLERFYQGSASLLFASFLRGNKLSQRELDEIKEMIEKYEDQVQDGKG